MCIGLPMRVIACDAGMALCDRRGGSHAIDTLLLGAVAPGDWVLVFQGAAVRVLDAAEAGLIDDALDGLAAALEGRAFDHLFADLIGREPQLPAHLRTEGEETSCPR